MSEVAVAHRLTHDAADQLDDRCLIVEAHLGGGSSDLALIVADLEALHQAFDVDIGAIGAIDEGADRRRVGNRPPHRSSGSGLDRCTPGRAGVRGDHDDRSVFFGDGDHAVGADDLLVEKILGVVRQGDGLRVEQGHFGDFGDRLRQFGATDSESTEHDVGELQQVTVRGRQGDGARLSTASCSLSTSS